MESRIILGRRLGIAGAAVKEAVFVVSAIVRLGSTFVSADFALITNDRVAVAGFGP